MAVWENLQADARFVRLVLGYAAYFAEPDQAAPAGNLAARAINEGHGRCGLGRTLEGPSDVTVTWKRHMYDFAARRRARRLSAITTLKTLVYSTNQFEYRGAAG